MIRILILSLLFASCGTTEKIVTFKNNSSETGIYESDPNGKTHTLLGSDTTTYKLETNPSIPIDEFESLIIADECYADNICVNFKLSEAGSREYKKLTTRNLNKKIFYLIDGVVINVVEVKEVITGGMGQISIQEKYFDSLFLLKR